MYRIYINESVLIITEFIPGELKDCQVIEAKDFDFNSIYKRAKSKSAGADYVILTQNAKRLFKKLKNNLFVIKAAGGLVQNEENKYLFIFRRGKWDLPKGKIDPGERTKKAAVREVEEECGIRVNEVSGKLCKTWHVYEQNKTIILKKTTWYRMKAVNQPDLIPQLEEDITGAKWLSAGDFQLVKQNTFPLILDVIRFTEV